MQAIPKTEGNPRPELILTAEHKRLLRELAVRSIEHGLRFGQPLSVEVHEHPEDLRILKAVFVTLRHREELRGCVGTLEATLPLVSAVTRYAFAAAFNDARFDQI